MKTQTDKPTTTASATPEKVRTVDHRTLEGANTNKAPKGVRDKTYKYFGASKAEYEAAQTRMVKLSPQRVAELEKLTAIKTSQPYEAPNYAEEIERKAYENEITRLKTHADNLAEALRKVAARLDHNGRVESHWQEGYDVREALAAYEAAQ